MDAGDGERRIDAAMIVHDQSVLGAAHAYGVDVLDLADLFGGLGEVARDPAPRFRDFVRALQMIQAERLDVGVDLARRGPSSSRIAASRRSAFWWAASRLMRPSTSRSRLIPSRPSMSCTMTWWTKTRRLAAISMTRSRMVSSSSAAGSAVTVISDPGSSLLDRLRDLPLDGGDVLQGQGARHAHEELAEDPPARRAYAHARDGDDAGDPLRLGFHALGQAFWSSVQEGADGALRKAEPGHGDEQRDKDRDQRVGLRIAERGGAERGEHQDRVDEVRGEVERVGFESLAAGFSRHALELPPAPDVDDDRPDEDSDGGPVRFDAALSRQEAPNALERDRPGKKEQKSRFDEGREGLVFAVAVMMLFVGRPVRGAARRTTSSWSPRRREGYAPRPKSGRGTRSRARPRPSRA